MLGLLFYLFPLFSLFFFFFLLGALVQVSSREGVGLGNKRLHRSGVDGWSLSVFV